MPVRSIPAVALVATILAACEAAPPTAPNAGSAPGGDPTPLAIQPLFEGGRFPNVVVLPDGALVATWGSERVRSRRSSDGGVTWEPEVVVADPGFHGGGTTVDATTGHVFVFVEAGHPPAPLTVHRSANGGRSWSRVDASVEPDPLGHLPSMHMNEHGITLERGEHAGRLLRPSRWYAGENDRALWPEHYTNAVYSDDGGTTWTASAPFPARGTGEATLVELADGTVYYNTRRHWAPEGVDPRHRWAAVSRDGGATWTDLAPCPALPDGPQDTDYGCMAGLTRLPDADRDVLLYSNCDSAEGRSHGTVWVSFDGGETWPLKRLVEEGAFAYSSMVAGRPGTPSGGFVYLHYESDGGSKVARFDLEWLLAGGTPTGYGTVPPEFRRR